MTSGRFGALGGAGASGTQCDASILCEECLVVVPANHIGQGHFFLDFVESVTVELFDTIRSATDTGRSGGC